MWSAFVLYDEGRLGHIGVFGLKSREEAIAWLQRGHDPSRCWYLAPSWKIEEW